MITNDELQPGAPEMIVKILAVEPIDMANWYAKARPTFGSRA